MGKVKTATTSTKTTHRQAKQWTPHSCEWHSLDIENQSSVARLARTLWKVAECGYEVLSVAKGGNLETNPGTSTSDRRRTRKNWLGSSLRRCNSNPRPSARCEWKKGVEVLLAVKSIVNATLLNVLSTADRNFAASPPDMKNLLPIIQPWLRSPPFCCGYSLKTRPRDPHFVGLGGNGECGECER